METRQIIINGSKVTVILTCKKYFFHDNYWGIIGIATRESELGEFKNKKFSLIAGNKRMHRNNVVAAMKRFIKKEENKPVDCNVEFIDNGELCNHYLEIKEMSFTN